MLWLLAISLKFEKTVSRMSRMHTHPLSIARRLKSWAVMTAVVALTVWLFEFSTHVHPQDELQGAGQAVHHCTFCAAFQAGAGAPTTALLVPAAHPFFERTDIRPAIPRPASQPVYQSRAPPHV